MCETHFEFEIECIQTGPVTPFRTKTIATAGLDFGQGVDRCSMPNRTTPYFLETWPTLISSLRFPSRSLPSPVSSSGSWLSEEKKKKGNVQYMLAQSPMPRRKRLQPVDRFTH